MRYHQLTESYQDYEFDSEDLTAVPEGLPDVVKGNFKLTGNTRLTSLKGCPSRIDGNFSASSTSITSLEGGPRIVSGDFNVGASDLASLEGAPEEVGGNFEGPGLWNLTSFKGFKTKVGGKLHFTTCAIKNFVGCPDVVNGTFMIGDSIESFEGCPSRVNGNFHVKGPYASFNGLTCEATRFVFLDGNFQNLDGMNIYAHNKVAIYSKKPTSLSGVHKAIRHMKDFYCGNVSDSVLGLLLVPGLQEVDFGMEATRSAVAIIVNRYLEQGGGRQHVMACQAELIEAGFDDFAQL